VQHKRAVVCSEKRIARLMFLKRLRIYKRVYTRSNKLHGESKKPLMTCTTIGATTKLTISSLVVTLIDYSPRFALSQIRSTYIPRLGNADEVARRLLCRDQSCSNYLLQKMAEAVDYDKRPPLPVLLQSSREERRRWRSSIMAASKLRHPQASRPQINSTISRTRLSASQTCRPIHSTA
jgi:hypothetical protein